MIRKSPGLALRAGAPRPFAVGVLALAPGVSEPDRWDARLEGALRAYKYGYFLLDVIEVEPRPGDPTYLVIDELATRTDADAFVVQGAVDLGFLREVADQIGRKIRCSISVEI